MAYFDKVSLGGTLYDITDTKGRAMIAPKEATSTASAAHAAGTYFTYNDLLYRATADIAAGGTITPNTNCVAVTVGAETSELKSAFDDVNNQFVFPQYKPEMGMEIGAITNGNGSPDTDNTTPTRAKTRHIATFGAKVTVSGPSGYYWSLVGYDENNIRVYSNDYRNTDITITTVDKNISYIRVVYKVGSAGTDAPDLADFSADNYITLYSRIDNEVDTINNKITANTTEHTLYAMDATGQSVADVYKPDCKITVGNINTGSSGNPDTEGTNPTRAKTRYIVTDGGIVTLSAPSGYYCSLIGYDKNKIRVYGSDYSSTDITLDCHSEGCYYIRGLFKYGSAGTTNVNLSDFAGVDCVAFSGRVAALSEETSKGSAMLDDIGNTFGHDVFVPDCGVEVGGITNGQGSPDSDNGSTQRARTRYIASMGGKAHITAPDGYYVAVIGYDYNHVRVYIQDFIAPPIVLDTKDTGIIYLRLLFKVGSAGTTNVNLSDFTGVTPLKIESLTAQNYQQALYQPSITYKSIAHRGRWAPASYKDCAPMCSKLAVIRAMQYGFQYVENDVAYSRDGYTVMWHDPTFTLLGNMQDANGYLLYFDNDGTDYWYDSSSSALYTYDYTNNQYVSSSVSLATLTQAVGANYGPGDIDAKVLYRVDIGSYVKPEFHDQTIMSFEDWVKIAKVCGLGILVDFKKANPTQAEFEYLINIVKINGMLDVAQWARPAIRAYLPNATILFVNDGEFPSSETLATWAEAYLSGGEVIYSGSIYYATEDAVQRVLSSGIQCYVWMANMQGSTPVTKSLVYQRVLMALNAGVQGITMDYYKPEDAVREKYAD